MKAGELLLLRDGPMGEVMLELGLGGYLEFQQMNIGFLSNYTKAHEV